MTAKDAGDDLAAALTHEKLDTLIEAVAELKGRLEAMQASLDALERKDWQ